MTVSRTHVTVLALTAVVTGCVLAVDAIIPASDAVRDARLLGTWAEVDGSDTAVVSGVDARTYGITYVTRGNTGRFQARLGRVGGRLVLDVWPTPPDSLIPEPYDGVFVAGHVPLALELGEDEVSTAVIRPDTLLAALRARRVRLPYVTRDEDVILTGSTAQLRSALGPYLTRPNALDEPGRWRRVSTDTVRAARHGVAVPCFEAAAWREADQVFHRDPHWLGADVASTVDLGGGRILWLFGDTWIDPTGRGTRRGARMVSNSVGIQTGTDPSTATMAFSWGRTPDGAPDASFPDRAGESLWFGNGVRVDDRLVLFFARTVRNTGTGLGFEHVGWAALMVENPDDAPSAWRVRELPTPPNPLGILVGFATVLRLGDHVVALGSQNPVKSHPIFAARWSAQAVRRGDLRAPEWWAGDRIGWVPDSSTVQRWPIFENGQSELTVHYDRVTRQFLGVQTQGFGVADLHLRAAPSLTGPWTATRMLYRPPEFYRPNVMIYAGKAHPELTGGDLVLTYATNTFAFQELLTDSLIYYPRFVRLTRCE